MDHFIVQPNRYAFVDAVITAASHSAASYSVFIFVVWRGLLYMQQTLTQALPAFGSRHEFVTRHPGFVVNIVSWAAALGIWFWLSWMHEFTLSWEVS